jgi:hypothetical protein
MRLNKVIPKHLHIAWNLLHLLEDDFKKVEVIVYDYNKKFSPKVTRDYLGKVIAHMNAGGFIWTKKGAGVRRSLKARINLLDVAKHFGVNFTKDISSPAGRAMYNWFLEGEKIMFINNKISKDGSNETKQSGD